MLEITRAQASGLQRKFDSEGIPAKVYVGMKHWHPFIEETIPTIVGEQPSSIVGLALAPHYSRMSMGGYEDAVRVALARINSPVQFVMVRSWHTQPQLISALSRRVHSGLDAMDKPSDAAVLFTAHSLPRRAVIADDPYEAQLMETSRLVADEARARDWDFAFQSAGEPADSWLGPMLKQKIEELSKRGFREVLICPVGFVSDHLEILYDLDIEAKAYGLSLGMKVARTPSLNDDQELIGAIAETIKPVLTASLAVA